MAGRKAHIQTDETFDQFIQSIPEDARGRGYWKIRLERTPATGGLMQVICGFLEFQPGEAYDSLRSRIKNSFADNRGPGVYFATPCDQEKKEIKNLDKARFEYKEGEVEMPENIIPEASPLGDALKNVRKMSTDMAALQKMKLEQQFMEKALGIEKKEEDAVKEPAANSGMGVNDIFMWKTFLDNGEKKTSPADSVLQQQLSEMKMEKLVTDRIEKAILDLKTVVQPKDDSKMEKVLEKLIEIQSKPKDDDKVEKLLERLLTKDDDTKQEDRRREDRQREENRATEERRRWEAEIKQREEERKEERRRYEDEIKRREGERLAEERRRDEERQKEERRRDDERKEERKRLEETARLERDKYERELAEQRRRFDEDAKLRREEIKSDDVRTRQYSSEQQKFQLQLLDLFKNNKDSGLEMTSKVVESLTAAGMSSMKTAQDAAESIMEIARSASPRKEKDGMDGKGFMDNIKDIAQLAAPFFTPYADADAKIKVLNAASKLSGASLNTPGISDIMGGGVKKPKAPMAPPPVPGGYTKADIDQAVDAFTKATGIKPSQAEIEAAMAAFGMSGVAAPPSAAAPAPAAAAPQPKPAPTATQAPTASTPQASAASASASKGSYGGLASMIAQYLKAYPILKHALIGNLRDKIGVRSFMPVVTGLNQPTLEGLLANVPHQVVMGEIKQVCSEEEAKLIDENEAWFSLFRKEMIEVIKESEEDEDEGPAPINLPEKAVK
jgi:hypothetical protein